MLTAMVLVVETCALIAGSAVIAPTKKTVEILDQLAARKSFGTVNHVAATTAQVATI